MKRSTHASLRTVGKRDQDSERWVTPGFQDCMYSLDGVLQGVLDLLLLVIIEVAEKKNLD